MALIFILFFNKWFFGHLLRQAACFRNREHFSWFHKPQRNEYDIIKTMPDNKSMGYFKDVPCFNHFFNQRTMFGISYISWIDVKTTDINHGMGWMGEKKVRKKQQHLIWILCVIKIQNSIWCFPYFQYGAVKRWFFYYEIIGFYTKVDSQWDEIVNVANNRLESNLFFPQHKNWKSNVY